MADSENKDEPTSQLGPIVTATASPIPDDSGLPAGVDVFQGAGATTHFDYRLLPAETWLEVFTIIGDQYHTPKASNPFRPRTFELPLEEEKVLWKDTLRQVTLSCRWFRQLAQPLLFGVLEMRQEQHVSETQEEDEDVLYWQTAAYVSRLKQRLAFYLSDHIAPQLRCVLCLFKEPEIVPDASQEVYAVCISVVDLFLEKACLVSLPHLRTLACLNGHFSPTSFPAMRALKRLDDVVIVHPHYFEDVPILEMPAPFTLTTLFIKKGFAEAAQAADADVIQVTGYIPSWVPLLSWDTIQWIIILSPFAAHDFLHTVTSERMVFPRLQVLRLDFELTISHLSIPMHLFPSLTTLDVMYTPGNFPERHIVAGVEIPLNANSGSSSLKTARVPLSLALAITLAARCSVLTAMFIHGPVSSEEVMDAVNVFASFLPSLEVFAIGQIWEIQADIILASLSKFPKLNTFHCIGTLEIPKQKTLVEEVRDVGESVSSVNLLILRAGGQCH